MQSVVTVSIVSHGHNALLPDLLRDLANCPEVALIVVTCNIPESTILEQDTEERLIVIHNSTPKGFGANHNAAFQLSQTPYFLVLNPDVRLQGNPFPDLLAAMEPENIALAAPAVVNTRGQLEDNARSFPSLGGLIGKALGRDRSRLDYLQGDPHQLAPWIAGVFMLFRHADFESAGGFDERFFLYYEDVDLCARLWDMGRTVILCPSVLVVHDAQRSSHYHPRYMFWHALSMIRYFRKHVLPSRLPVVE